jgi:hypothetical protein
MAYTGKNSTPLQWHEWKYKSTKHNQCKKAVFVNNYFITTHYRCIRPLIIINDKLTNQLGTSITPQ